MKKCPKCGYGLRARIVAPRVIRLACGCCNYSRPFITQKKAPGGV